MIAFAVIWSVLFVQALTLPAAFLAWDRQFEEWIEQDVRRILVVVAEPQAFPRVSDLVRRGQVLVERGAILGGVIYENMLPDADPVTGLLPTAYKNELQAAGVGTGFAWVKYEDSRIS